MTLLLPQVLLHSFANIVQAVSQIISVELPISKRPCTKTRRKAIELKQRGSHFKLTHTLKSLLQVP